MKVLIIRHGQTDWNIKRLLQGTIDIELNEVGISQATEAKKALADVHIDLAVCSPLKRARKTAEIILEDRDVPIIYDERITERKFGKAEGLNMDEIGFGETWSFGVKQKFEGMESPEELTARVGSLFDELYEKYPDKTILVVTHGGTSIGCGLYFCGIPDSIDDYFCQNCVVKTYTK